MATPHPYRSDLYNAHRDLAMAWLDSAYEHALKRPRVARICIRMCLYHCGNAGGAPDIAFKAREIGGAL